MGKDLELTETLLFCISLTVPSKHSSCKYVLVGLAVLWYWLRPVKEWNKLNLRCVGPEFEHPCDPRAGKDGKPPRCPWVPSLTLMKVPEEGLWFHVSWHVPLTKREQWPRFLASPAEMRHLIAVAALCVGLSAPWGTKFTWGQHWRQAPVEDKS